MPTYPIFTGWVTNRVVSYGQTNTFLLCVCVGGGGGGGGGRGQHSQVVRESPW